MQILHFLSGVVAQIRKGEYVSGSDAKARGVESTGKDVFLALQDGDDTRPLLDVDGNETDEVYFPIAEADEEIATQALTWIREQVYEPNDRSYTAKLHRACREEQVSPSNCNMIASLIPSYSRAQNAERVLDRFRDSEHMFTDKRTASADGKGDRIMVRAEIVDLGEIQTWRRQYGKAPKYRVLLGTENGNLLHSFSTSKSLADFRVGDKVTAEGTLVAHDAWEQNGIRVPSTVLSRLSLTAKRA